MLTGYGGLYPFYGDIHNHCNIGYGHGSIEDAFQNARLQLDFACVTVHAHWPDIPVGDERLAAVVDYHQRGFERTRKQWPYLTEVVEANHEPGRFVTFHGFEWHSLFYGDHNVYFKDPGGEIIRADSLAEMRAELRRYRAQGFDAMLLPHHIGYRQGYRGVNWATFTPEFSPVVEIMSMHGASESDEAPYPYLHTMGPRDWRSAYQYGLLQGNVVGVVGSTDHHSAHPGSYGHGRLAVWADALTRDAVWDAIQKRRTVALTGDNIALAFALNGQPLGSFVDATPERNIEVEVIGGGALDYVDVVHNNRVIHRWNGKRPDTVNWDEPMRVHFEVGWGEKDAPVVWQVELEVAGGELLAVEPRFRGYEIVAPQANEQPTYAFSEWQREGENGLSFRTRTWGNPTTTTANTQGVCLEIRGDAHTKLVGRVNGIEVEAALSDLISGPISGYLGGFLTPAYYFHRAVPQVESRGRFELSHTGSSKQRDWYYARVRQKNGQWAWSSPIWVKATND